MKIIIRLFGIGSILITMVIVGNLTSIDAAHNLNPFGGTVSAIKNDKSGSAGMTEKDLSAIKKTHNKFWKSMFAGRYASACKLMTTEARGRSISGQKQITSASGLNDLQQTVQDQVNSHNDPEKQHQPSCAKALSDLQYPQKKISVIDVKDVGSSAKGTVVTAALHYKRHGHTLVVDTSTSVAKANHKWLVDNVPDAQ